MYLHLLSAVASTLLAVPVPKDDAKGTIEGMWEVVSAKRGDKENTEIVGDTVEFKDGKVTIKTKIKNETGTYKIDASKKPATIDIKPQDEEQVEGIYAIDGDKLKLCFGRPGAARPKEFATGGDAQIMLIELKRQKK